MEADDGGLKTVVTGRPKDFATESAYGNRREVALGFFQFNLLDPVIGFQCGTTQDVLQGLFTSQKQSTIRDDSVKGLGALVGAEEANTKTFATGEDEAGDIKQAEGVAGAADVGAEGIQAFVFRMNRDIDVLGSVHPFALRWGIAMAAVTVTASESAFCPGGAWATTFIPVAPFGTAKRGAITSWSGS